MLTTTPLFKTNPLLNTITNAYRMDEATCLKELLANVTFSKAETDYIITTAKQWVSAARKQRTTQASIDFLLHQYDLSTEEGIALMCLAEALLRTPDKDTIDRLISDKISTVEWKNHLSMDNNLLVNAATWSLLISGKIFAPTLSGQKNLLDALSRAITRLGVHMIRPIILQMMKLLGKQFVLGENISIALKRATHYEKKGYLFSYDMLGEAAHTKEDAEHYYADYEQAIKAIGAIAKADNAYDNPGISVKLSALHPRYEITQRERLIKEVPPRLLALAQLAKQYHLALVVDAEETDRLDLSLEIFAHVYADPSLANWEGLGLAVQAYQKRAFYVLDWLLALTKEHGHGRRLFVRLVKGAYWDAEIKMCQMQGLAGYPVFTRKDATDVSYLACAHKLLQHTELIYPQFGTHNAYTVAAILAMVKQIPDNPKIPAQRLFEFQCLFGMGSTLYDQIITKKETTLRCRIYAPVGTHQDLLAYLVRRLLENGANSSFVNMLADEKVPLTKIIYDPVERLEKLVTKANPHIPLPINIYGAWQNSEGIDISNRHEVLTLKKQLEKAEQETWQAGPIIDGKILVSGALQNSVSPGNKDLIIGQVRDTHENEVEQALITAKAATLTWGETTVAERVAILQRAATLLQQEMPNLLYLLAREGGRCLLDAIAEVREAIDYCRYYAYRAQCDLQPLNLAGVTGESNQLFLAPRGVFVCISPWNFPVAIFTGQIVAALSTGNAVLAKPAEQTPLCAFKVIQILHRAGVPKAALQLLPGRGETIGAKLVSDPRVDGVIFTGSTETAKHIQKSLANRPGPIATFIAETGGLNAMIVDSTALAEQTVLDIAQSAFNSAGQRCSALRVLFLQAEVAPKVLKMLEGFMAEMVVGDPCLLATDIGPVIDSESEQKLQQHFKKMQQDAKLIAQVPLTPHLNGHYFAPCAFEITDLSMLKEEIFGPILHVIRYQARDLEKVIKAIINTGYGLTLGIQSRINATVQQVAKGLPVGNVYVNRNMIGAVVGVQPFGGERLSGTGPKAGGPHYLPRLCVERAISINTAAIGGNASLVSLREDD